MSVKVLRTLNETIEINTGTFATIAIAVLSNTGHTLAFEGSPDNGTTWVAVLMARLVDGAAVSSTGSSGTGVYRMSGAGLTRVRARVSVVGTSASVQISGSPQQFFNVMP